MPTHYALNSQSPMVSDINHAGESNNYDGNDTGVVPDNDDEKHDIIRVVSSSDMGEVMPLSEGNNSFRQITVNSNAASIILNGGHIDKDDSEDNEDNEQLYKKSTKGGPIIHQTAGGNNDNDIVTNGAPCQKMASRSRESSGDEDGGIYGKGNNPSKGATVGGSEWNSFRSSD